jgi:3-deoxy-D-manno-octulosonate 8-phosphate phosphatase (KDO 8-P phosphatase)
MSLFPEDIKDRARVIKLLLLDVDGVLTDGTVSIQSNGVESKAFYIRDGAAIVWARRHGLDVGFLSARPSEATSRRAAELGVRIVSQRAGDKRVGYADILSEYGVTDEHVSYMADDLLDLPILGRVALSAAPADAVAEVVDLVHWVSKYRGGRGAVRELIELILRVQGKWDALLADFPS